MASGLTAAQPAAGDAMVDVTNPIHEATVSASVDYTSTSTVTAPAPAPLQVALMKPTAGSMLSGVVKVRAAATGGSGGVSKVGFWTDGWLRSVDATAPYAWSRDTAGLSVVHQVGAAAFVGAGNRARASVTVTGRVTGPPTARGDAVLVPLHLTRRAGRALKLGTRRVRVRLSRRARLPLSGAGAAGASRLAPRALRRGDRLRGVTSLSNRAHLKLRDGYRPTLTLRRARVIRAGRRGLAPPGDPGPSGDPPPSGAAPPPGVGTTTSCPTSGTPTWASGFETGSFSEWKFTDDGPGGLWPDSPPIQVVDPTTQGVPYRQGTKVGRFEVSDSDRVAGRIHAKMYKHFGPPMPADVGGTYCAWVYLSPHYTLPSSREAWANIFQWKEWANGGSSQDPLWWLDLRPRTWVEQHPNETWVGSPPAGGDDPVAFIDYWRANNNSRAFRAMTMPRGRWVELRAVLVQRQRIDFYVDGQFLDTAFDSSYPVSPFRGDPQGFFIFGVGNYGTASGVVYVDDVSYTKP